MMRSFANRRHRPARRGSGGRPAAGRGRRSSPLPPRALVQIGTDDLRTRDPITDHRVLARRPAHRRRGGCRSLLEGLALRRADGPAGRAIKPPEPDGASRRVPGVLARRHEAGLGRAGRARRVVGPGRRSAALPRRAPRPGRSTPWRSRPTAGWSPAAAATAPSACGRSRGPQASPGMPAGGPVDPVSTPAEPGRSSMPDSEILSLAFTPDGTRLVAGATFQASIFVWRLSDGHVLQADRPGARARAGGRRRPARDSWR